MIDAPEEKLPRPLGTTVLGVALLLGAAAFLANAARAAAGDPGAFSRAPVMSVIVLLAAGVLPAVWLGATGVGLLRGASWARASFFAIAALVLVVVAGLASRKPPGREGYPLIAAALALALFAGGGVWYLLREDVKGWFR